MADFAEQLVTLDEFLSWDDGTDRRYQLLRGVITMMAPAQTVHGRLASRLAARLTDRLRRPCEPIVEVGVKPPHRNDTYYVADVGVTCRPLVRGEVYLAEPVLLAEILSPSTEGTDRLLKLPDYRLIPSVADILLVATATARVEHWHREDDGWKVVFRGPGETVDLLSLDTRLAVDELYRDLPLEPEDPPPA